MTDDTTSAPPAFLPNAAGLRLAYRHRPGTGPTIVFLPGYMSDMMGSKALALDDWAAAQGRAMLRLDYAGCGESEGRFEDGTLASWRDDARAVIEHCIPTGPIILVGSSMGGWLALLLARDLGARVAGLVGIAAAPDFTDWGFGDAQKATLQREGKLVEPTPYGDQPYVTTRAFWESGEALRLLDGEIAIECPIRLLQGQADADVPWQIAVRIAQQVRSADVQTLLVKDGDHRLSRPQDIALLIATVARLVES
ncbi:MULTISPECIES: alpha/beta fold hydrolase [unclassified Sphingobium]|uniref:alpha/beta fold hydrolase n=1 Tax=unclassified Sphingobium TaxID=2611147 RepID=UPI0022257F9D|nr:MULTISPECIES: alpha/beta hydrolase [unclassified Sphingobium]MCW2411194.1 pimeloyl-ACP methyl ester carboxylesterase [Sphingobium sp. B8D3D]MCW2416514.1 pimeloyl-ACP methyl ester carboxylesterase [Sphingobium sp. B8D3A]